MCRSRETQDFGVRRLDAAFLFLASVRGSFRD